MRKDRRTIRIANLRNSYNSKKVVEVDFFIAKAIKCFNDKGYSTEFCCSGHTDQKHLTVAEGFDGNVVWKKCSPRAYILFTENYGFSGQQLFNGNSYLSVEHCGTLRGIKSACKKMYRFAESLPSRR